MNNLIPEDYRSSMPTIEEIEEELKDKVVNESDIDDKE